MLPRNLIAFVEWNSRIIKRSMPVAVISDMSVTSSTDSQIVSIFSPPSSTRFIITYSMPSPGFCPVFSLICWMLRSPVLLFTCYIEDQTQVFVLKPARARECISDRCPIPSVLWLRLSHFWPLLLSWSFSSSGSPSAGDSCFTVALSASCSGQSLRPGVYYLMPPRAKWLPPVPLWVGLLGSSPDLFKIRPKPHLHQPLRILLCVEWVIVSPPSLIKPIATLSFPWSDVVSFSLGTFFISSLRGDQSNHELFRWSEPMSPSLATSEKSCLPAVCKSHYLELSFSIDLVKSQPLKIFLASLVIIAYCGLKQINFFLVISTYEINTFHRNLENLERQTVF